MGFLQSLIHPLSSIFEPISLSLSLSLSRSFAFRVTCGVFGYRQHLATVPVSCGKETTKKVSVLMSLQELINVGKGIGYSGAELQTFVRDQQDRQREERQLEREARREDAERETRKEQAEREARKEEAEREARKE